MNPRRDRAAVHMPSLLVLLAGLLVAYGGYRESIELERARLETRFVEASDAHAGALLDSLDTLEAKLRGVVGLYAASKRVERAELEAYWGAAVAGTTGLEWLAWVPPVARGEREAFEARVAGDSYPGFEIRSAGDGRRAADGSQYLPIELIVPLTGNESLLGRDLGGDSIVLGLMGVAQREDALRLNDAGETVGQRGTLLAAVPGWLPGRTGTARSLRGHVLAAVDLASLASASLATLGDGHGGVAATLSSSAAGGGLVQRYPLEPRPAERSTGLRSVERRFQFAGTAWVLVCVPRAEWPAWRRGTWPAWLGAGLLLLFVVIAAFVNQTLSRKRQVERLVALRSGQLLESQNQNAAILGNVVDAIVMTDGSGLILRANRATERLFGYEAAELTGMNVEQLLPASFDAGQATTESGLRLEMDGCRKDGTTFPAELAVGDIETEQGTLFAGVVRDLTESKRVEQMKDEFVSIVSHELRTPLTSILGSLGLIKGGLAGELNEKLASMIDIAHSNGERLVRLINDILDMEKLAAGKMELQREALGVASLISDAVDANQGFAAENDAKLAADAPSLKLRVVGDRDRLLQVLTNLISNACKYSPAGGTVTVSAAGTGGRIRFTVRDEGAGIPLEQLDAVFEKFVQVDATDKRSKAGTGLGLSIVRAIIEQHGGRVGVDSQPGEVTTFWFELPLLGADRVGADGAPLILVCEDDPDTGRLLQELLAKAGYSTRVVPDAASALAAVAIGGVAAMTLDLELPDRGGLVMLRELRASPEGAGLPVVVVSGTEIDSDAKGAGRNLGVSAWVRKPIDGGRLIRVLRESLPADA